MHMYMYMYVYVYVFEFVFVCVYVYVCIVPTPHLPLTHQTHTQVMVEGGPANTVKKKTQQKQQFNCGAVKR